MNYFIFIATTIIIGFFTMANSLITPTHKNDATLNNVNITTEISTVRYVMDTHLPKEYFVDTTHITSNIPLTNTQRNALYDWEFHTYYDPRNNSPIHIGITHKIINNAVNIGTIQYLNSELITTDTTGQIIYLPDDILSLEGGTVIWQKF